MSTNLLILAGALLASPFPGLREVVHGILVDARGKPIGGAELKGFILSDATPRHPIPVDAVTNANGRFTFDGAPALPTEDAPARFVARLPNGHFAEVVLTKDGGIVKVEERTTSLRVRVLDGGGNPLARASVDLEAIIARDPAERGRGTYSAVWNTGRDSTPQATGADGWATFEGVPVGLSVMFSATVAGRSAIRANVAIPESGAATAQVRMVRAVVLTGTVLRDGVPVPHVRVDAMSRTSNRGDAAMAETGADGRYRISDLPPGEVMLSAESDPAHPDWVGKPLENIRVREGEELDGLNLVFEKGVRLSGRVLTREGGQPVSAATLIVGRNGENVQRIKPGADGRFSATVYPGNIYVAVEEVRGNRLSKPAYLWAQVDAEHNPALELRVPDAAAMDPIRHLHGTVVDATGAPVAGAAVRVLESQATATTDGQGHFRFGSATQAGSLVLAVKGEEMGAQAVIVKDDSELTLKLDSLGATLEGQVVDQDGKPVAGAEVTLGGAGSDSYYSFEPTTTDATGHYRFGGLYGGIQSYFVWARHAGYGAGTVQNLRVAVGETRTVGAIQIGRADGVIEGRVFDDKGHPAEGVHVTSQGPDAPTALTDAKGRFRLTGVPRGSHFVAAGRGNSYGATTQAATGELDVVIRLPAESKQPAGFVEQDRSGQTAPALTPFDWVSGTPLDMASLRGKIVVLDFWAVWCGPCVKALPEVQALYEKYGKRGVVVIGIHTPGTERAKVLEFLRSRKLTYPVMLDGADATGMGKNAVAFGPSGIPHLFVISPAGKIVADTHDVTDADAAVAKLLGD